MICTDLEEGVEYVVKFQYDHSGKRVKTTCLVSLLGMDFVFPAKGTVTLDSRERHVKKRARKKALSKALLSKQSQLNKKMRTAIWASYLSQSKV